MFAFRLSRLPQPPEHLRFVSSHRLLFGKSCRSTSWWTRCFDTPHKAATWSYVRVESKSNSLLIFGNAPVFLGTSPSPQNDSDSCSFTHHMGMNHLSPIFVPGISLVLHRSQIKFREQLHRFDRLVIDVIVTSGLICFGTYILPSFFSCVILLNLFAILSCQGSLLYDVHDNLELKYVIPCQSNTGQ